MSRKFWGAALGGASSRENGAVTTPVDYMPLFVPVTKPEVKRFRQESKQRRESWANGSLSSTGIAIVVAVVGLWIVLGLATTIGVTLTRIDGVQDLPALALPLLGPILLIAIIAVFVRRALPAGGRWEGLLRRTRFAAANGLQYVHKTTAPNYPGAIFNHGSARFAFGNYRRPSKPELDIGSYRYTTGSGKNKTTHTWGYVALRLPRKLPHMLLDAKGNNGLFGTSNLPSAFSRQQILSLEGDFDRYFTLYCPRQYERDALYVFTPDLMALLIDESAAFDMEIVENWMFLYRKGGLDTAHPATLQRVFRIIDTVGAKAQRRTERYADERIGDRDVDLVASQGLRLRRDYRAVVIITAVVIGWIAINVVQTFAY